MSSWMTRFVAGNEKVWIGVIAVFQTYVAAVEWLVEPEKALVIGLLGVGQIWLGTNSPTPPDLPHDPADDTTNPPLI